MNRLVFLLLLTFLSSDALIAQKQRFRMMEYNVENLFDTLHAVGKADLEFTPTGEKKWNSRRYWSKIGKLSRIIAAIGEERPADLVALIEVENDSVISDLIHHTKLWRLGYQYLMTHSEDPRGINIALLYQPHRYQPFFKDSLRIAPLNRHDHSTRDILHVAGKTTTGDTLDLFLCHFPSRKGGRNAEKYRMAVAKELQAYTERIQEMRQSPYLIITGDFNAFYPEKCLTQGLKVALPSPHLSSQQLYLFSHTLKATHGITGTYKFQGNWDQLDHFILNGNLILKSMEKGTDYAPHCQIADFPMLLSKDRKGNGVHPYRTYLGNYYTNGYSDHLPLVLDLYY